MTLVYHSAPRHSLQLLQRAIGEPSAQLWAFGSNLRAFGPSKPYINCPDSYCSCWDPPFGHYLQYFIEGKFYMSFFLLNFLGGWGRTTPNHSKHQLSYIYIAVLDSYFFQCKFQTLKFGPWELLNDTLKLGTKKITKTKGGQKTLLAKKKRKNLVFFHGGQSILSGKV